MIKPLIYNDTQIIWELLSGKPDPYQPIIDPINDLRARVLQKKLHASTCWYYAIKRINTNYGKRSDNFPEKRKIEKKFSKYKKEENFLTLLPLLLINRQKENVIHNHTKFFNTLGEINRCRDAVADFEIYLKNESENTSISESDQVDNYVTQLRYQSVMRFCETELHVSYCKIIRASNEKKLWTGGCDVTENPLYKKISLYLEREEIAKNNFKVLNPKLAFSVLHIIVVINYLQVSGFIKSEWNSDKSIDFLIEQIKKHGPLFASGKLGRCCYTQDAEKSRYKIANRSIWYWKPGTYNNDNNFLHAVIITGAENTLKGKFVYYIDPNDASDPNNAESQKIYKISYDRLITAFTKNSVNICGRINADYDLVFYNPKLPNFKHLPD